MIPIWLLLVLSLFFWVFLRQSLCNPDWPGAQYVNQTNLELKKIPSTSASEMLELKDSIQPPGFISVLYPVFSAEFASCSSWD